MIIALMTKFSMIESELLNNVFSKLGQIIAAFHTFLIVGWTSKGK